jgi:hypothetical protein
MPPISAAQALKKPSVPTLFSKRSTVLHGFAVHLHGVHRPARIVRLPLRVAIRAHLVTYLEA